MDNTTAHSERQWPKGWPKRHVAVHHRVVTGTDLVDADEKVTTWITPVRLASSSCRVGGLQSGLETFHDEFQRSESSNSANTLRFCVVMWYVHAAFFMQFVDQERGTGTAKCRAIPLPA